MVTSKKQNFLHPQLAKLAQVKSCGKHRATEIAGKGVLIQGLLKTDPNLVLYFRQEPFAKMTFFKVDLNCFLMEKSISQIIYTFSLVIQIRCRKPHFEIR